jgi:SAM-dependent methyltransferase
MVTRSSTGPHLDETSFSRSYCFRTNIVQTGRVHRRPSTNLASAPSWPRQKPRDTRVRSADDFDSYYKSPDPWGIGQASCRDRALAGLIGPYVVNKSVLELGCGEGHLTGSVFRDATSITGIDISPVAISRASSLSLPNASFQTSDFLDVSFAGYDVVAGIECLYYLSPSEQEAFYQKLTAENAGKLFILSGPIIGSNEHRTYFTHAGVIETFYRHGLSIIEWRNLNAYRKAGPAATLAAALCKLPFGNLLVTALPEKWVYQRCYVARCADSR